MRRGTPVKLESARRILVVTKFRYLGDTIVATPFLRSLKQAAPNAEISLLTGPAMPVLLKGCPYLASLIAFSPKGRGWLARNLKLIKDIRAGGFDAAFLVNRSLHTAVIASWAKIPIRIGYDTEHRGRLLTHPVKYDWERPDRECAFDLLRAVGIPGGSSLPELWVDHEERADAAHLLKEHGFSAGRLLVGMQPGANDPEEREWGAAKFAKVADRLVHEADEAGKRGAAVVFIGSAEERTVSEQVASYMSSKPIILTGETTLRQALATISLCRLWVSNDGGLLHAAVALSPATVGIFGPTKAKRWGYNEPNHRTVSRPAKSAHAGPAAIRRCLDAITPDEVFAAAMGALSGDSLESPGSSV